jgi:hypothetical protein
LLQQVGYSGVIPPVEKVCNGVAHLGLSIPAGVPELSTEVILMALGAGAEVLGRSIADDVGGWVNQPHHISDSSKGRELEIELAHPANDLVLVRWVVVPKTINDLLHEGPEISMLLAELIRQTAS